LGKTTATRTAAGADIFQCEMHFSFNFQSLNVYVRLGAVKSIDRRDRLMIEIEIEHT